MSLRVNRNLGPFTTGPQSIFALKQWLTTSHGGTKFWSVVASGDGLAAYSSTGDVITHSGSGANGLDNNNAWFVLRDPDDNREILFHRGAPNYLWYLWYLRGEHFDTTSAGAAIPATHGNKKSWMGARATPGPFSLFPSSGSWYFHICCEGDTPEGNVYPFWAVARVSGSGAAASALILDCVLDALSPATDSDKAVLLSNSGVLQHDSGAFLGYANSSACLSGYMRFGEANVEWSWYTLAFYGDNSSNYYPGTVPTHPEDGKFPILPGFYWRRGATTNGVKGQSKLITYKPSTTLAAFGDTMYDGTDYHLMVDHVLLRGWPDATGPLI